MILSCWMLPLLFSLSVILSMLRTFKLQIFNEFNARKPDEYNIFKGVTRNYLFMGIVGFTVVLQVSLFRPSLA